MSCWLCGNESEKAHHLGCARIENPGMSRKDAEDQGLVAKSKRDESPKEGTTEVLKPGTMNLVPEDEYNEEQEPKDEPVPDNGTCEHKGCTNEKYSDSPRAKYCADHKDPKNRKE